MCFLLLHQTITTESRLFPCLGFVNRHFPFLGEAFRGWILLDSPFSETPYWGSFVVVVQLLSCLWPFCNPIDYRLPGSSVYGIFQAGIMELVAISFSKEFSWARDLTHISCTGKQILYPSHQGSLLGVLQFSSVQSLSRVQLFATPWTAARQASLSITNAWSSLKLMSIESVMPSSHLILCCPLLLLPPMPPRVFSNESTLPMRWPKYWSFSFSIIHSEEHPGLISFRMDWLDLLAVQGTLKSLL